jgi:hypothetical protein
MTATGLPLAFAQLSVVFGCLAALQTAVTWWAGRRAGSRGLLVVWIGSALLVAVVFAFRVHQRQTELGFRSEQRHDSLMFFGALGIMLLSFGCATLVVRRRLQRGLERLGVGGMMRGVFAALGGFFVVFLVVFLTDVAALLKSMR